MSNLPEPRGILNRKLGEQKFKLHRWAPVKFDSFIEHFWMVDWDLRGQEPFLSETLPHPSVHLIFEKGKSRIDGVMKRRFSYHLLGCGRVFGIKFKPGGFYPYFQKSVSSITDQSLEITDVFNIDVGYIEGEIMTEQREDKLIKIAESILENNLPHKDKKVEFIAEIVQKIQVNSEITSVERLAKEFFMTERSLQRLFQQYVGVSPKWVIKRYRLHEAAERLGNGLINDLQSLAMEMGYYDQSHFIHDFKQIVGRTPQEYLNICN